MINLVFGSWAGQWGWRVEWRDDAGTLHTRDFIQKDLQPGVAKAEAQTFIDGLKKPLAA